MIPGQSYNSVTNISSLSKDEKPKLNVFVLLRMVYISCYLTIQFKIKSGK